MCSTHSPFSFCCFCCLFLFLFYFLVMFYLFINLFNFTFSYFLKKKLGWWEHSTFPAVYLSQISNFWIWWLINQNWQNCRYLRDTAFPNRFRKVEGRDPNWCPVKWKVFTNEPHSEKHQRKTLLSARTVHIATCISKQVRNVGGQPQTLARGKHISVICRKLGCYFCKTWCTHHFFFSPLPPTPLKLS